MSAECAVASSLTPVVTDSVEVSGWDAEGQFFAEMAILDVSYAGDLTTSLCHRITNGSLMFVRLLSGPGEDTYEKGQPTANEAYAIEAPDFTSRCRIRLTPCQPQSVRRHGDQTVATRI
jgi:hypothetical protein